MEAIVILVTLFAASFGMYYMFITARNRERLALIEKGADASLFKSAQEPSSGAFGKI